MFDGHGELVSSGGAALNGRCRNFRRTKRGRWSSGRFDVEGSVDRETIRMSVVGGGLLDYRKNVARLTRARWGCSEVTSLELGTRRAGLLQSVGGVGKVVVEYPERVLRFESVL